MAVPPHACVRACSACVRARVCMHKFGWLHFNMMNLLRPRAKTESMDPARGKSCSRPPEATFCQVMLFLLVQTRSCERQAESRTSSMTDHLGSDTGCKWEHLVGTVRCNCQFNRLKHQFFRTSFWFPAVEGGQGLGSACQTFPNPAVGV